MTNEQAILAREQLAKFDRLKSRLLKLDQYIEGLDSPACDIWLRINSPLDVQRKDRGNTMHARGENGEGAIGNCNRTQMIDFAKHLAKIEREGTIEEIEQLRLDSSVKAG